MWCSSCLERLWLEPHARLPHLPQTGVEHAYKAAKMLQYAKPEHLVCLKQRMGLVYRLYGKSIGEWQIVWDNEAARLPWALQSVEPNYHPSCTLPMGTEEAGVVGADGSVHGTTNLSVCDANIMLKIPTANLYAPVIMMADRIANQLRRDGSLNNGWTGSTRWSRNGVKLSSIGKRASAGYLDMTSD